MSFLVEMIADCVVHGDELLQTSRSAEANMARSILKRQVEIPGTIVFSSDLFPGDLHCR